MNLGLSSAFDFSLLKKNKLGHYRIMNVLVIDVGGTNVKILATGQKEPVKFPSGPAMTAKAMVAGVSLVTRDHGAMLGLTPGLPESMLSP